MTLLSIAQDVADAIGLTRPAAIITGQDQNARQMLGLAKETLEELGLMEWPILQIPYSFNTVAGQAMYTLPADFDREVGDTVYSSARYASVRGQLTAAAWAKQRNELPNLGRFKFRIFGLASKLQMYPVPDTVEEIVIEYQTKYRVRKSDGTYQNTYTDDQDVSLVPEDLVKLGLKWRLRRAKGMDYSEEFDVYEFTRNQRYAQQLDLGSLPVSYRSLQDDSGYPFGPYIPEVGFG